MGLEQKNSNKKIGNKWEKDYCRILSENGYWATLLYPKPGVGSQPCDIVAIKNNEAMLIDCKTCATNLFSIDRIEENQRQCFKRYSKCGNTTFYLAILWDCKIYKVNLKDIDFKQKNIDLEELNYENYSF